MHLYKNNCNNDTYIIDICCVFQVLAGNFNADLIKCRSIYFGSLLYVIVNEPTLREARCTVEFFQEAELTKAKVLMIDNKYDQALTILENLFTLLNRVHSFYVLIS